MKYGLQITEVEWIEIPDIESYHNVLCRPMYPADEFVGEFTGPGWYAHWDLWDAYQTVRHLQSKEAWLKDTQKYIDQILEARGTAP